MTRLIKLAIVALSGLMIVGTADAQVMLRQVPKGPLVFNPNALQLLMPKLKCVAAGSPLEFPDDVALVNNGTVSIASGTKVAWAMPGHGSGTYVFGAVLGPNHAVYLPNVLSSAVGAGTPCTVKFL